MDFENRQFTSAIPRTLRPATAPEKTAFQDNRSRSIAQRMLITHIHGNTSALLHPPLLSAPVQRQIKGLAGANLERYLQELEIRITAGRGYDIGKVRASIEETMKKDFKTTEDFEVALMNAVRKVGEDYPYSFQDLYMTEGGWRRRAEKRQPAPVGSGASLKIYRTMPLEEWVPLRDGKDDALSGHLGDFDEAFSYLSRKSDPKVLVEFVLRPGAERELFSPRALALPTPPKKNQKLETMKQALESEGIGKDYAPTKDGEGKAENLVGIKMEQAGTSGFSFSIGGGNSPRLFMHFVDRSQLGVVGVSDGKQYRLIPKDPKYGPE